MWLSSVSVGRLYWNCLSAGARGQSLRVDAFRSTASEYASGLGELHYSSVLPFVFFSVTCFLFHRTIPVAERFFTSSASVTLRQAAWYPSETEEPHLVLLTSDNTIRYLKKITGRGVKEILKNLASFTHSCVFLNPQDLVNF